MINITILTVTSAVLVVMGWIGMMAYRKHIISMLLSLEVMLLGVNLHVMTAASIHGDATGHVLALFIMGVAAAEAAIGLALAVAHFRRTDSLRVDDLISVCENTP
jgi:NADH-quinone oxidoreductase subunit K